MKKNSKNSSARNFVIQDMMKHLQKSSGVSGTAPSARREAAAEGKKVSPFVSVVIPVYNVEKYLRECLDSVIRQTLRNIEIICVNDASPDNSMAILREYEKKDSRVVVIDKPNGGLSSSRNAGDDAASGKYIMWLDSDDYLDEDALEILYETAEKDQLDIVMMMASVFYDDFTDNNSEWEKYYTLKNDYPDVMSGHALFSELSKNKDYKFGAVLRFTRREHLKKAGLRFYEGILHEDTLFSFMNDLTADRIRCIRRGLYHVRKHHDSITTAGCTIRNAAGYMISFAERIKFLKTHRIEPEYQDAVDLDMNRIYSKVKSIYADSTEEERRGINLLGNRYAEILYDALIIHGGKTKHSIKTVSEPFLRPLVSIVMPVFNAQGTLCECLASLERQSMREFEVICIDDGSSDNSLEILHFFAQIDARIHVVHQSNSSAGAARNRGMEQAVGKYLFFMDADDYAADNMLQKLLDKAEAFSAEITVFTETRFDDRTGNLFPAGSLPESVLRENRVYSSTELKDRLFGAFGNAPWNKLFQRKFIEENHLRFQEIVSSNDLFFVNMSLALASRIAFLNSPLYFYRTGATANLQSRNNENPFTFYEAYAKLKKELSAHGLFDGTLALSFAASALSSSLHTLRTITDGNVFRNLYDRLRSRIFDELDVSSLDAETCPNKDNYEQFTVIRDNPDPVAYFHWMAFARMTARRNLAEIRLRKKTDEQVIQGLNVQIEQLKTELEHLKKSYSIRGTVPPAGGQNPASAPGIKNLNLDLQKKYQAVAKALDWHKDQIVKKNEALATLLLNNKQTHDLLKTANEERYRLRGEVARETSAKQQAQQEAEELRIQNRVLLQRSLDADERCNLLNVMFFKTMTRDCDDLLHTLNKMDSPKKNLAGKNGKAQKGKPVPGSGK